MAGRSSENRPARHVDHLTGVQQGIERVHAKGGRAVDHAVVGLEQHAQQQIDQFIGPGPSQQIFFRQPSKGRQSGPQGAAFGVWVDMGKGQVRQCLAGQR
jgi:hypothetical protein